MPSWIPRLKYEVVIEPERITFANGDVRVEVEPRLWVSEDGRVLSVGDRPHPLLNGYEEDIRPRCSVAGGDNEGRFRDLTVAPPTDAQSLGA